MEKLQYCLMLCCFTLNSIHEEAEALFSSCKAELMVPRGTAWKTSPQRNLTVQCPVKHCGESLNVTWCKLYSQDHCEAINNTETVKVTQIDAGDELTSYLTFKAISASDDGLYRCYLKEPKDIHISHTINISVSDLNQGTEYLQRNKNILHSQAHAAEPLNPPAHGASWLPYFFICFSVPFLAILLTMLTHLSLHNWNQKLNCNPPHGEPLSSCMIPDLPKRSDPTSPVLQAIFPILTDRGCPCSSGTTPPSTIPSGNQPQANAANRSEEAECATYAVINHKQHGSPARKLQTNNPQYSTIIVS